MGCVTFDDAIVESNGFVNGTGVLDDIIGSGTLHCLVFVAICGSDG